MIKRVADYIFLTRPVVLLPVIGFALLGSRSASGGYDIARSLPLDEILPLLFFTLSVAAVYVANQISDLEVDRINGGAALLTVSGITRRGAVIFAAVLALLSLILPVLMGEFLFALFSLLALILGYLYCFKPFYATGRPFFDFISNSLGYGLVAFLAGWSLKSPIGTDSFLSSIPYLFSMAAGSISSTIPDMEGDESEGKITTAIFLGSRRANHLATLFILLSLLSSLLIGDNVALIISIGALPLYLLYVISPKKIFMESTYKVGGAFSMLAIGIFYPVFIIVGVVTATLTVLFFRSFYGLQYPSLLPLESDV